jgi:sulfate adenylyltransferase subunit 1
MTFRRDNIDLLRFSVIGNVDDGKSTLIGRLLYDSKSILEDRFQSIQEASKRRGEDYLNLALLTDGLRAEREQGVTIDVAYMYFATPKRKFIIADCPGHVQFTRNMVTGTSSAQASIILIDARNGMAEQTKRHSFICSMMGVKHLIVCVNKMDLVEFSESRFEEIVSEMRGFPSKLDIQDVHFVPISALHGDNIVNESAQMPWYRGSPLLYLLENLYLASDHNFIDGRFAVQKVIRPMSSAWHDFRGYAGRVDSGIFRPGEDVVLLPSGFQSRVKEIFYKEKSVQEAFYPMSVTVTLADEFDFSRGDMLAKKNNQPEVVQDLDVLICWFGEKPLVPSGNLLVKHTTKETKVKVKEILYKIDIHTLSKVESDKSIGMNDIARIRVRTAEPLMVDKYRINKNTGSLILIDGNTNYTVASGIVI